MICHRYTHPREVYADVTNHVILFLEQLASSHVVAITSPAKTIFAFLSFFFTDQYS
jgi:hypothetical protein